MTSLPLFSDQWWPEIFGRGDHWNTPREVEAPVGEVFGEVDTDPCHNLVPLCTGHHREQHDHGVQTFAARHGLDLLTHAHRIAAELDARGLP